MNPLIRQIHRWLSMAFAAGFVIVSAAMVLAKGAQPPFALYLLVLIPLFGLFGTGLWLFALPYVLKARAGRAA